MRVNVGGCEEQKDSKGWLIGGCTLFIPKTPTHRPSSRRLVERKYRAVVAKNSWAQGARDELARIAFLEGLLCQPRACRRRDSRRRLVPK